MYIAPAAKASKRYKVGDFVSVKISGAGRSRPVGRGLNDDREHAR